VTGAKQLELPTKPSFDWSLGPSVARLRDEYGSDYALFVFVRDSYATSGRIAVMVLTAILTRGMAQPQGGSQVAFASLVDLRTGDIVWFNQVLRRAGDLRTRETAGETVALLLKDFPK